MTTPASKPGVSSDAPARPVEAADSLRLTGEATNLQAIERELTTAPAIDAQRVAAVRESLQNGTYKINPDAIASRMLDLDQQLQDDRSDERAAAASRPGPGR